MPRREKPHEPWHDVLTLEEAKLIDDFDKIIETCRHALADASHNRGLIRTRAQMRLAHRRKKEET